MAQVFISYSRKDLAFVEQLAADLKKAGLDVWYDISRIAGGAHWRSEIENALRKSQAVIVVLSPDSIVSDWVEREFLFSSNLKRKIIPVMFRRCELPLNYVNLNYIDVQGDHYVQNFDGLLKALDVDTAQAYIPSTNPLSKRNAQYAVLMGGGTILLVVLLSLFFLRKMFSPPASPAFSTSTSRPASTNTAPVLIPTETFTPIVTPLLAENTDDKGIKMILVPAGDFTMGSNNGDPDEVPVHTTYLSDFYMDVYEVTNDLYKFCVDSGVCTPPHQNSSTTHPSYYGNPEFSNYPVIYVDWFQASAYCEWRGASLPTEAQWEKAARGTDARTYPWGEGIDCQKASYGRCHSDIDPVGSYEAGKSPFGIYDLAGNVWEWVADWYSEIYYASSPESNPVGPENGTYRVLRGGTWDSDAGNLHTSNRLKYRPAYYTEGIGFRCAKAATP